MEIFYDKIASIYKSEVIRKKWTDVKVKTLLYENVKCDYYIATRGHVVNYQPDLGNRQQDLDRMDLVIPPSQYNESKPILQGYYVKIWIDLYIIDSLDYYKMPDWTLECIYIRLNQKWV